tara:strand:+ start:3722 stop:3892 length:171 start_codon:yes stop_codon:yes gene_type:complete
MLLRIVETDTEKVICEGLSSYEEAWVTIEQLPRKNKLEIQEYKVPITGLGRDPDLH